MLKSHMKICSTLHSSKNSNLKISEREQERGSTSEELERGKAKGEMK